MDNLCELIRRFASCDMPILITGESGTGKEFVARKIHSQSGRKAGEFVALDCSEILSTLIAGELFGYEEGAFNSANECVPGLAERANRGTLFLDEIGALPFDLQ